MPCSYTLWLVRTKTQGMKQRSHLQGSDEGSSEGLSPPDSPRERGMQVIRILYDVFGFTPNSGLRLFGNAVPSPTSPVPQTQCSPTRGGGAQGLGAERAGAREGSPAARRLWPPGSPPPPRRALQLPSSCPPRQHPTQAWRGGPRPAERREGWMNGVSSTTTTLQPPPPPIPWQT